MFKFLSGLSTGKNCCFIWRAATPTAGAITGLGYALLTQEQRNLLRLSLIEQIPNKNRHLWI